MLNTVVFSQKQCVLSRRIHCIMYPCLCIRKFKQSSPQCKKRFIITHRRLIRKRSPFIRNNRRLSVKIVSLLEKQNAKNRHLITYYFDHKNVIKYVHYGIAGIKGCILAVHDDVLSGTCWRLRCIMLTRPRECVYVWKQCVCVFHRRRF